MNIYQHDKVSMVFKSICILVHGMKVALALVGLRRDQKLLREIFLKIYPKSYLYWIVKYV